MGHVQHHEPGSTTFDTIDHRVTPILFVPGVMGTRLNIVGGADWDPDSKPNMLLWATNDRRQIVKALTSETPAVPAIDLGSELREEILNNLELKIQAVPAFAGPAVFQDPTDLNGMALDFYRWRGWGQVSWKFYGPILKALQLALNPPRQLPLRHPVWVYGYDWRQCNQDSGRFLIAKIYAVLAAHPKAKQVIIVTHSMGGLVCRSALLDGALDAVAGVVHTVQPSCGTPVAYRRFHTGALPWTLDAPGENAESLDWATAGVLSAIQGFKARDYAATQSGLRGPLQLLPSNDYPEMFLRMILDELPTDNLEVASGTGSTRFQDLYDVYLMSDSPGIVPEPLLLPERVAREDIVADEHTKRLRSNLERARRFHQRFRDFRFFNCHPLTYSLYGRGKRTDILYDDIPLNRTPAQRTFQASSGDGTVAEASSQFRGARPKAQRTIAFPVEHAACFSSADFNQEVLACVRQIATKVNK